jgi:hypothetical protein
MSSKLNLNEQYGYNSNTGGIAKSYQGEIEFEIRDRKGRVVSTHREKNIVKIFAKEILAHRLPHSKVWDTTANAGAGGWTTHSIDLDEYSAKYIVFGASYDESGNPLDAADTDFYTPDTTIGGYIPLTLGPGAQYDGGLIKAIPIAEPSRPLKRIERIYFEPSYQPAGTPLLQEDVRCMNNVVVFETTLTTDEYNGLGVTTNDYLTLTEVALVGAAEIGSVGSCECDPRDIFLTGRSTGGAFLASANGTATVNLDISESEVDAIMEGDQIKIVQSESTANEDLNLNQLNPYYMVVNKAIGGRDITLDRVPVDIDNNPITGSIGLLRDGFRIFSHRILKNPVKKSSDFEIICRWRIIMN